MRPAVQGVSWAMAALLFVGAAQAQTEIEKLHQLFDEEWAYTMEQFPETATSVGYPGQDDRWTDMSEDAIEARQRHARELVDRIEAIDRSQLDAKDQLNYDLFLRAAREDVEGQPFDDVYRPVNQLAGVQQDLAYTIAQMPRTVPGYEDIVARLRAAPTRIAQEQALLERGLELGVTPPKITLRDVPDQVKNQIVEDPLDSPLLQPFRDFPESVPEEERERLRAAAVEAYRDGIRPAFEKLRAFLVDTYVPQAAESIAASDQPNGKEWYAYRVRLMTTTDMTPEAIHELGLEEVKRIRVEMDRIIRSTGFEGSFEDFCTFLRTDSQFYFENARDLVRQYRDIAKRIDPELPRLFGTLPRLPYGVQEIPAYAAKSQTTAYYQPGAPEAGRPGWFFANTYDLKARPKWEMEALTLHEAVPGHHLQIALAQELTDVPEFRKHGGYTAFVEGWGLYAESLGDEIGMFADPYSKFGQLTYEMWRAVRLVVDTGMHALGWTRQQAIDYFAGNTCKQLHDITVEIDRYIVWPGQALAYKLGELTFKELRAEAKEALGSAFDVRAFHDVVLENGALPLDLVKAHVRGWIAAQAAETDGGA